MDAVPNLVASVLSGRTNRAPCPARLRSRPMAGADVDVQVVRIGALLNGQLDHLVAKVVAAIRAEVPFYKNTQVVPDDVLVPATANNLQFIFQALVEGTEFDTSPAVATGGARAAAKVPLAVVMHAFRVASHVLWDVMIELAGADPG